MEISVNQIKKDNSMYYFISILIKYLQNTKYLYKILIHTYKIQDQGRTKSTYFVFFPFENEIHEIKSTLFFMFLQINN